jgi:hypothetical protein
MTASTMAGSSAGDVLPIQRRALELVVQSVEQWLPLCEQFLDEQRSLLLREPSPGELAKHRLALGFLIRGSQFMKDQMADPEFPDTLARQLGIRLRQLVESWNLFYRQMPQTEADEIIGAVFPNER